MKVRLIRMTILVLFCAIAFPFSARDSRSQQNQNLDRDAVSATQGRVLKTDLEKMETLLEQMQRNVAFVSPGDTPLKHQFQLEIEMWQLLIRDMQKNTSTQQAQ